VRIKLDRDLCQGHGTCCAEAPEVFELDDAGRLQILQDEPGAALRESVRMAVKYCPTHALALED